MERKQTVKIVAVSGGVDSVVLLDVLVKQDDAELIVAHVDHGIREKSGWDERFVAGLAEKYGLRYVYRRLQLGSNASEETARTARYDYLFEQAKRYAATVVTAHHMDDLVESIAINLRRGTGARGLSVMNRAGIERPLLAYAKKQLYNYAVEAELEWLEDETNSDRRYLRNELRPTLINLPTRIKQELKVLRDNQVKLVEEIEQASTRLATMRRHEYIVAETYVADEMLRAVLREKGLSLTGPQRERALLAIKTARPHTTYQCGDGVWLKFSQREFVVVTPKK